MTANDDSMSFNLHISLDVLSEMKNLISSLKEGNFSNIVIKMNPPCLDDDFNVFFDEKQLNKFSELSTILNDEDIGIHVRFPTLYNEKLISVKPSLSLKNHLGESDPKWICPNQKILPKIFLKTFKLLREKGYFNGVELSHVRFPLFVTESTGYSCFCNICQENALKKRSIENLIDRSEQDLFKKGFNLSGIREFLRKKELSKIKDIEKVMRQKQLQEWIKFRRNSITRFVGAILVQARKVDQDLIGGCDVPFLDKAELIGQDFSYLLSYQDIVYFWFSSQIKKWKKNFKKIQKAQKKAEGKTAIGIVLPIESITIRSIQTIKEFIKEDPEVNIGFYEYKENRRENLLKILSENL